MPCGVEGVRGSLTGPLICTPFDLLLQARSATTLMTVGAPHSVLQVFSVAIKRSLTPNTGVLVHTNGIMQQYLTVCYVNGFQ